jgi:hypothetical protein
MKRAFLHGFGWYAIIVFVVAGVRLALQQFIYHGTVVIFSIIAALAAIAAFQMASPLPPSRSWVQAIVGWLFGFASSYVAFAITVLVADYIYSRYVI